jgi:hypothetical protein
MATKYILDPSGKILKKDDTDGNSLEDAYNVSKDYLSRQKNYKESISLADVKLGFNVLPLGGIAAALTDVNITDEQKATLKTDSIFPENIFGSLVNSSFGFDNDSPLKNYTSFDSFNGDFQTSSVFADELEILAGYDFNSLGFISAKGADLTALFFVTQYLINTIVYIIVANEIYNFFITDNISGVNSDKFTNFERFFSDHLGLRFFGFDEMTLTQVIVSFIHGFDLFLNTDPKNVNWLKKNPMATKESPFDSAVQQFVRTVLSFSKQGYNRLNMLIRKFQMQSYWHTNILYKAKTTESDYIGRNSISQENPIDKFFVEFSRYYFKFIIERVQIGKISAGYRSFKSLQGENVFTIFADQNSANFGLLSNTNRYSANKRSVFYTNGLSTLKDPQGFYDYGDLKFKDGYGKGGEKELYVDKARSSDAETKIVSDISSSTLQQLIKYDFELLTTNREDFKKYKYKGAASQNKRFSKKLKDQIEKAFNREMAPFYFHDLRTNEMLSFHAFIDNISDSFQPQYSPITGFGRIDDAQHYTKTTRSISVSFSLVTMNEEDFALMWQQINKLVTLVYPQWSDGLPANTGDFKENRSFRFPFTQVPTASPLIRLKVGDLIRSNYTEYDMKKLYSKGIKNKFNKVFKKELLVREGEVSFNITKDFDKSKFFYVFNDDSENIYNSDMSTISGDLSMFLNKGLSSRGVSDFYLSGSNQENSLEVTNPKKMYTFKDKFKVKTFISQGNKSFRQKYYIFKIKEINNGNAFLIHENEITSVRQAVYKNVYDLAEDSDERKLESVFPAHLNSDKRINNPYQKAFESTQGLGLAGFITSLSIDTNNQLWETTNVEGRFEGDVSLPMGAKITVQFAPIHDIPPGIDATGVNRAEIYRDVITDMKERS